MRNPDRKLQSLANESSRLASEYVEHLARKILLAHNNLEEFVIGMGGCMFTTTINGRHENLDLDDREYFQPLRQFLFDWDNSIGITGEPMRFTAFGPKVTDW